MLKNLNDGQCHSYNEIKEAGLENAAKQFAEGNNVLEKVLLNLWDMGIETTACCKGEHTKDHNADYDMFFKFPYISFNITEDNKEKLIKLIHYISNEKGNSKPNIVYKNYIFNNEYFSVLVLERTFLSNANANKMFDQLLSAIQKMQEDVKIKKDEDVLCATQIIEDISSKELFIAYGVKAVEVKINHNQDCGITFKNLNDKIKKQKINKANFNRISKFCNQFLLDRTNYSV